MVTGFLLSCSASRVPYFGEALRPGDKSPEVVFRMVTDDLLARPDFMIYRSGQVYAVHYAEACAGFGAVRLAGLLKDSVRLQKLSDRYLKVITDSIANTANHVDASVYDILPLELFRQNRKEIFRKQGLDLADKQWENPLPDGMTNQTRYWIDDVWMIAALQVQAYRVTGNSDYLDKAALETDAYIQKLQQPEIFTDRPRYSGLHIACWLNIEKPQKSQAKMVA